MRNLVDPDDADVQPRIEMRDVGSVNPFGSFGKGQSSKLKVANQWKLNIPICINDIRRKRHVFVA